MNVGLPLPVDEASQLAARTIFSTREIQSLYKRFKELDISGNNILEYEVYILDDLEKEWRRWEQSCHKKNSYKSEHYHQQDPHKPQNLG